MAEVYSPFELTMEKNYKEAKERIDKGLKEKKPKRLSLLKAWRTMRELQHAQNNGKSFDENDMKKLEMLERNQELQQFILDNEKILGEDNSDFVTWTTGHNGTRGRGVGHEKEEHLKEKTRLKKFWIDNYGSEKKPKWWGAPTVGASEKPGNYIKLGGVDYTMWLRPDFAQEKVDTGEYEYVDGKEEIVKVPDDDDDDDAPDLIRHSAPDHFRRHSAPADPPAPDHSRRHSAPDPRRMQNDDVNVKGLSLQKRDNRSNYRDLDKITDSLYENVDQLLEYVHQQNDIIANQSEQISYLERKIENATNRYRPRRRRYGRGDGYYY